MRRDDVLSKLHGVKKRGDEFTAHCPAHDDQKPSLTVREKEGKILLRCHAGCSVESIVSRLGLKMRDLFTDDRGKGQRGKRKIVNEYNYEDEQGKLLYQVMRFEPKDFRQRRPDGNDKWVWSLRGVRRVLYRLPELLAANPAATVFIVEGEKDADALFKLNLVATTNVGGAGKWRPEYSGFFGGRHVVILPDNDQPGRNHAEKVARSLQGVAASVKVIHLPHLKEHGDVSDWLDAGNKIEILLQLVEMAPE